VTDPTKRFSNRVDDYVRYRPNYPADVVRLLEAEAGLTADSIVADVGSGTGISAKLFLGHGNAVYGVEPNREMRQAAERILTDYPRFQSIAATAENTTLADRSVDFVVAGQAFHWFDRAKCRIEFARILRPGGYVVLTWNNRLTDTTPFLREYEQLICDFAIDYRQVDHRQIDIPAITEFFTPCSFLFGSVPNHQLLDLAGLLGRIASSSYMPAAGHPNHTRMVEALERLFNHHQQNSQIEIQYDTILYFGHLT
jgi:SAM-dependent methyltransferase